MPKTLLEGFFLAKLLNEEAEKFKKDLIENHPDSQEAKTIHKEGGQGTPPFQDGGKNCYEANCYCF